METLPDIRNEEDIQKLVHTFYDKVNADELLGPIFNDVAKVNWEEHLPHLCRFWSTLLFRTMTFEGRPFPKHAALPIQREHFVRWVGLFTGTVDELFAGPKAEEAKNYARSIADSFQLRLGLLEFPFSIRPRIEGA
ncbi:MAG TPA: group III truncated hemoglobin [Methylomirabilota bacterium]|nr:group III truncated hemoglobin [Methylomirabilota bacterium]